MPLLSSHPLHVSFAKFKHRRRVQLPKGETAMRIRKWLMGLAMSGLAVAAMGAERKQREVMQAQFGANSQNQQVVLETVYIPPGEFWMRSTPEEKKWETGIE